MGMFDEVRAINISHENFRHEHNGHIFQTKGLDCLLSEYCVFNGMLYQELDGGGERQRHDYALKLDYSGTLNIYTDISDHGIEQWVEYDLVFNLGELVDVVPHEVRVTRDDRDLSARRPSKPTNRVELTISVSSCDRDKQDAFIESIDEEKLQEIRDILCEPTATVFYPVKTSSDTRYGVLTPRFITVGSFVQTNADISAGLRGMNRITAPNGDNILIVTDEFGSLSTDE